MHIIGEVNEDMLRVVSNYLQDCSKKGKQVVSLSISSEGGNPDVALAIAGLIKRYNGTVNTTVYGYAFSSAVLIFAAGHKRTMSKYAWVMVHEGSDNVDGNAGAIKHFAKNMEKHENHWNSIMQEFTDTDSKIWEKLSEKDTYLNAEECLKLNLATEIC